MTAQKVSIVGAGFSGLTAAYYLSRTGFDIDVYEKSDRAGGLIQSIETQWGLCETAANGIINSLALEEMAHTLDLKILPPQKFSKKRFIYRNGPREWPLSPFETLALAAKFSSRSRKPKPRETIEQWGIRVLGKAPSEYLLFPFLQGIYAGNPQRLSSSLILSRFFNGKKKAKPTVKGLVSFPRGMGELCQRLKVYLESRGVRFHFNFHYNLEKNKNVVLATAAPAAGELLREEFPKLSQLLSRIEMVSLVTATCFFIEEPKLINGFGVLFPKAENFESLGVLFNSAIFPYRSQMRSETFILGGVQNEDILKKTDQEIIKIIVSEREEICGSQIQPVGYRIQRWNKALPHYTVELEEILSDLRSEMAQLESRGVYLHGNYLGGIGLSQILEQSSRLVERFIPYE